MTSHYQVLENFDSDKDYQIKIQPRFLKFFSLLNKGETINPTEYANENHKSLGTNDTSLGNSLWIVKTGLSHGIKMGIVKKVDLYPISFQDFCQLETVDYFANQLRGGKFKNVKSKQYSTRSQYLYKLWEFNNWLVGKSFEFSTIKHIDQDTFKQVKEKIKLESVEHFLHLFQNSQNTDSEYVKIIKRFLMSDIHGNVSPHYIKQKKIAITSYFERNDSPIKFHFDSNAMYSNDDDSYEDRKLTLEDLLKMLTTGQASVLDRAVVLCKFHRGLDNSTFVDRFNFEAWEQLVKWFGSAEYENWDLTKCPVPIILTRIKTDYKHRGFLDRDAIEALQKYLHYRYEKTGKVMSAGEPLFLNKKGESISLRWVQRLVQRLAKNAGIQKKFTVNGKFKNEKTSHELRDLLKSTLVSCGVMQYVCELGIGHKIGDSYEKQDKLYPEQSRIEYAKASDKINIFSNISHHMEGDFEKESLRKQVDELKEQNILDRKRHDDELADIRSTISRLLENESLKKKIIQINRS